MVISRKQKSAEPDRRPRARELTLDPRIVYRNKAGPPEKAVHCNKGFTMNLLDYQDLHKIFSVVINSAGSVSEWR